MGFPPAGRRAHEAIVGRCRLDLFWRSAAPRFRRGTNAGESKFESATGDWQRALKGVLKAAGILDGHAHRFRDTFAVELLKAGVPMGRVSVLLGHSSIKITAKHYSPWVCARQEQLEADVRRTWGKPLLQTKGTPEVQEKREAVN